jgi:small GTP-binding protein
MFLPEGRPPLFKVVFLGNASTGKTSLIRRYCDNAFTEDRPPTIGSAFVTRSVLGPAGPVPLQIWDTAGEERYRSLVPMYSRGAAVAVIVFDLSSRESFDAVDAWVRQVHADVSASCRVVVAANKLDLPTVVPIAEIDRWASERNCPIVCVSARSGENVAGLFDTVVSLLPRLLADRPAADGVDVRAAARTADCC